MSVSSIEHKEDVNDCKVYSIIVKPTSVVLKMLQDIELYINSHSL